MNKKLVMTAALALSVVLTACGSKAPSQEEVEAAIRDGSVTVEDAVEKGWVTQEWADDYLQENTVEAADKVTYNAVGDFTTETLDGETFTRENLPDTAFVAFLDPADDGTAAFYEALTAAADDVRAAGADILVCNKGDMDDALFQDAPVTVVSYNDSMREALAQNDEMASGLACTGVWCVNGSLISAWLSQVEAQDLIDSAASFVEMTQETGDTTESGDGMAAVAMG